MERETEKKESMEEVVIPSIQVGFFNSCLQSRKEKIISVVIPSIQVGFFNE